MCLGYIVCPHLRWCSTVQATHIWIAHSCNHAGSSRLCSHDDWNSVQVHASLSAYQQALTTHADEDSLVQFAHTAMAGMIEVQQEAEPLDL